MKLSFFLLSFLFIIPLVGFAQVSDRIYVDEVDTAVVKKKPYNCKQNSIRKSKIPLPNKKQFFITEEAGILNDFNNDNVCETCKENYAKLKSASKSTRTMKLGLQAYYIYKKISFGIDVNYRSSPRAIRCYNDCTIQINNKTKVNYFMIGPSLGYKVFKRKKWDLDIYGSVNFSFALNQSDLSVGRIHVNNSVNLSNTPVYSTKNLLYYISPSITYKVSKLFGIFISAHYYFDNNSNVNNQQSFTGQRNSLGTAIGIKYLL